MRGGRAPRAPIAPLNNGLRAFWRARRLSDERAEFVPVWTRPFIARAEWLRTRARELTAQVGMRPAGPAEPCGPAGPAETWGSAGPAEPPAPAGPAETAAPAEATETWGSAGYAWCPQAALWPKLPRA